MIWNREQYISHCLFEYTGREMFCELFGPLLTKIVLKKAGEITSNGNDDLMEEQPIKKVSV